MKQCKNKIILGAVVIAILVFAFWYGGDTPALRGLEPQLKDNIKTSQDHISTPTDAPSTKSTNGENTEAKQKGNKIPIKEADEAATTKIKPQSTDMTALTSAEKVAQTDHTQENSETSVQSDDNKYSVQNKMEIDESTGKDKFLTDPVPEGKPVPVEPENVVFTGKELTCTLSVRCDTILNNIELLDSEKANIVPRDGVIFAEKTVVFYEGESVFNLLLREMKQNKIHMEFVNTPIYNSVYIEGIANLYEFDCGELSGWMYKVNDWFPNYGCSRYELKDGDKVEWLYTCDLGADIGGYYAAVQKEE